MVRWGEGQLQLPHRGDRAMAAPHAAWAPDERARDDPPGEEGQVWMGGDGSVEGKRRPGSGTARSRGRSALAGEGNAAHIDLTGTDQGMYSITISCTIDRRRFSGARGECTETRKEGRRIKGMYSIATRQPPPTPPPAVATCCTEKPQVRGEEEKRNETSRPRQEGV